MSEGAVGEAAVRLDDVKGFVFDVDGSLVHRRPDFRSEPVPGAVEVIEAIRASGRPLVLFTNGSHLNPESLAAGLREDGLPVRDDELLTPIVSATTYLRRHLPDRPVMVFGSDEIKRRMESDGIPLVDTDDAEAVFVAHVPQVDMDDLETAARAVMKGAPLLTANYGPGYWGSNGLIFSRGAMTAAAIAKVSEVEPIVVGKPSEVAVEATSERLGAPSEQHAVIGDDLNMDIALGHLGGSRTILVRTGMSGLLDLNGIPEESRPDAVIDGVEEMLPWLGAPARG
jgi:HAD superfamily hydrolase (TIGR01450 family)